ncbi:MAG: baseplate assembly protein [Desulfobacterales bacterium]|nr:baseplate assembly protein [Desulfobacterales bacterium]
MESDLKGLLKRVVELVMPNLRSYYRLPHKAEVIKSYAADGKYYADVRPLLNNEQINENRPILTKLEIPVLIGGKGKGIIGPPSKGTKCVLSYFDGDPNYPFISDFRWKDNGSPVCELEALIIQKEDGVHIKIDAEKNIKLLTSADVSIECVNIQSTSETVKVDAANTVEINTKEAVVNTEKALVEATEKVEIKSPEILLGEEATEKIVHSSSPCPIFGINHPGSEICKVRP